MSDGVLVALVDDDALILEVLQMALEEGGYRVVSASTASDAMALLQQEREACRALVTDIDIGPVGLTGWDLAKHARAVNPKIPVVYMSGASGHDWPVNGVPESIMLGKPFAPAQVVTAVSQLLNANPE